MHKSSSYLPHLHAFGCFVVNNSWSISTYDQKQFLLQKCPCHCVSLESSSLYHRQLCFFPDQWSSLTAAVLTFFSGLIAAKHHLGVMVLRTIRVHWLQQVAFCKVWLNQMESLAMVRTQAFSKWQCHNDNLSCTNGARALARMNFAWYAGHVTIFIECAV